MVFLVHGADSLLRLHSQGAGLDRKGPEASALQLFLSGGLSTFSCLAELLYNIATGFQELKIQGATFIKPQACAIFANVPLAHTSHMTKTNPEARFHWDR